MHVLPILADYIIHGGRIPSCRLGWLLLRKVYTELVLGGSSSTLFIYGPGIGFVAAANDAIVAGYIELFGVCRDDRQAIDMTLVSQFLLPSEHI
jgi:hypothetical protein